MGTLEKIIRTGLGAAFMTEDGVREAKAYLARQMKQRKEDLSALVAQEVVKFLGKINLHEELHKALQGLTFEVKIKRPKRLSK